MKLDAKIYIAGHQGLVGSAIIRKLTAGGYKNIITRTFKELDLRRQVDVEQFFKIEHPEYVVLAAAKVGGILANSTYKAQFIYDNLMIATNVIHAAYKYGVKRLINLGSSCIYPKDAPQPLKEEYLLTGPLEETNEPYAIAKIAAIKLCRYYNEQYGTQFISLMPTNLYGQNDNFNLETSHVLPALLRKLYLAKLLMENDLQAILEDIKKTPLGFGLVATTVDGLENILKKIGVFADRVELWGSGNVYREFMHVDDLAAAMIFLIEHSDQQIAGELINIGTGQDIGISQLAQLIASVVQYEGKIVFNKNNLDGTQRKLLDVTKLDRLEWQARISLSAGIVKVYQSYCSQSRVPDNQIIEEVPLGNIFNDKVF
jgi:GDP-L-fucose synthase